MTTSQKLWLGFGTLTALFVVVGAAVLVRVRSIENSVREWGPTARPRSVATREMEINAFAYVLAVRTYLHQGELQARQEAATAADAVEKHLADYVALAMTDEHHRLATEFTTRWAKLKDQGQGLLDLEGRPATQDELARFRARRIELEQFLDERMQPDSLDTYLASKDATTQQAGAIVYFVLILLIAGVVIAVATSVTVGRAVVMAEREAVERGERLRTTLASIGDAVITTDSEGRITSMNAVAESLTGWVTAEAAGQPLQAVFKVVNETTRQPVENPATRALRDGVVVGLANHSVLIARDGTERPIDDSAAPIRDRERGTVGCVLVFRDVTERWRAEEKLQAERQRVELVADAVPALIAYIDAKGCYRLNNRAYETWFGHPRQEVFGKHMREVVGESAWEALRPHVEAALTGRVAKYEAEVPYRDGGTRWVSATYNPEVDDAGVVRGFVAHVNDITDRKRAEERLRESEERFRGIFMQTLAGIAETDLTGRFVQVNQRYCQIVGRSADELYALRMQDVTHPDDLPQNLPLFERAVREGTPFIIEKRYVRPDGSIVWVSNSVSLVRDERGGPKHIVAASLDITESKRAELALRESEAHFRSMVDISPAMLWVTDSQAACNYISKQWCDYTGTTPEQNRGLGWVECVHPEDRESARTVFQSAHERHAPFNIDYRVRRHDGVYRWAIDTGLPRFDAEGRFQGYVGTVTDVHERKVAEERRRLLSEAAELLLYADDPDAMLRDLFARIRPHLALDVYFNYMADETGHGLRLASCDGIPGDQARSIQRLRFGQAVCGTVALQRRAIHATHIQQSDEPMVQLARSFGVQAYACNPLMAGERLLGTLSFARRSRDAFDAEELALLATISNYVAVAYERVRLMTELRKVAAELSDANRKKDEFLATLAHELRNPLAPIRTGLQVMKLAQADAAAVEKARSMMERQLEQMVRLIDDLMDVSRITRGTIELRKERVPLATVLNNAVETSRPLIDQMGHELSVTQLEHPVILEADSTRLAQVFGNLLNNAAKYSERGGHIQLTVERQGSDVLVSVKDTGIGIPRDKLTSIFDMFSQVDRSLEKSQGGLGIGLTLVKRLVEMHGGKIEASSEGPGKGSEFFVRLPVVVEASVPSPAPPDESARANSSFRVLIVDDNRDGADSLGMMLRIMGNETHTAYDGQAGVEVAERTRPDVILFDIGLPKLNGYEACRRIRQQPWGKHVILIAVTGWGQDEDRRRSHEAGFDHHMVKPVDPTILMKLLAGLSVVKKG